MSRSRLAWRHADPGCRRLDASPSGEVSSTPSSASSSTGPRPRAVWSWGLRGSARRPLCSLECGSWWHPESIPTRSWCSLPRGPRRRLCAIRSPSRSSGRPRCSRAVGGLVRVPDRPWRRGAARIRASAAAHRGDEDQIIRDLLEGDALDELEGASRWPAWLGPAVRATRGFRGDLRPSSRSAPTWASPPTT